MLIYNVYFLVFPIGYKLHLGKKFCLFFSHRCIPILGTQSIFVDK